MDVRSASHIFLIHNIFGSNGIPNHVDKVDHNYHLQHFVPLDIVQLSGSARMLDNKPHNHDLQKYFLTSNSNKNFRLLPLFTKHWNIGGQVGFPGSVPHKNGNPDSMIRKGSPIGQKLSKLLPRLPKMYKCKFLVFSRMVRPLT